MSAGDLARARARARGDLARTRTVTAYSSTSTTLGFMSDWLLPEVPSDEAPSFSWPAGEEKTWSL